MNALWANDIGAERWPKVQQLQVKLNRAAESSRTRRFHALYDKLWRNDVLERAWATVVRNGGAPGVDGVSIDDIVEAGSAEFLAGLAERLREGRYRSKPVRRVWIPKPDGGQRPLGVPTVEDRVVQAAAKLVLEPIFEADFADCSYGFRPGRRAQDALEVIRQSVNGGWRWVVDADIRSFFDTIDQDRLLEMVAGRVSDRRMLKLVRGWLGSGVLEGTTLLDPQSGTPQGGVVSPLLANIYLTGLDRAIEAMGARFRMVRYADDWVICCPSEADAGAGLAAAAAVLADLGLELHAGKTRICDLDGGDGFDFLGFHHRMMPSRRSGGRRLVLQKWPSHKAMNKARSRIRDLTARNRLALGTEEVVRAVNMFLRGWGNYFRYGNSSRKFAQLDFYVQMRLARLDRNRRRIPPPWKSYDSDWIKALGVHRLVGTVTYWQAHATR